mgnify:CR=1 FL=1
MSESSKMADLVLPACTSYEREEVHVLRGGRFFFSNQAIQPLGESKNDIEIIMGVMKKMGLKDEVLLQGYDSYMEHILKPAGDYTGRIKKPSGGHAREESDSSGRKDIMRHSLFTHPLEK